MSKIVASALFSPSYRRLASSWGWVREDFAEEFRQLEAAGAWQDEACSTRIWGTRHKWVRKVQTPSGRMVVYKRLHHVVAPVKFMLRPSPSGREAWNYQCLQQLGLPMARLLAVGDVRRCFILKSCFLVTEYAENTRDGRDFLPNGSLVGETALRDAFLDSVLQGLAKLHDQGWVHGGSTPANFLYRRQGDSIIPVWIDVATCCRPPHFLRRRRLTEEFVRLFAPFHFTPEERRRYEEIYLGHRLAPCFTLDSLFAAVEARLSQCAKH